MRRPSTVGRLSDRPPAARWLLAAIAIAGVVGAAGVVLLLRLERATTPSAGADPGPVHVHGLGIDPRDGALFIATHTGLWRAARGESRAERVGDRRPDLMGFTVVGPGHFLASGHPDTPTEPPLLGLVESRDAGRSWTAVSLSGRADFHVLRLARSRLYAYDASHGGLLASGDLGRSWRSLRAPATIGDLAVSPTDPRHLVATTDEGLHESRDGGRAWRPLGQAFGLLAWPRPRELLLLDADGEVRASADAGRRWAAIGKVGGEPAAFAAPSPSELYAALHDGTVKRSTDGGRSWTVRSAS